LLSRVFAAAPGPALDHGPVGWALAAAIVIFSVLFAWTGLLALQEDPAGRHARSVLRLLAGIVHSVAAALAGHRRCGCSACRPRRRSGGR